MLREPFDKEIDGKTFTLHKLTTRVGRLIMANYFASASNKLEDYEKSEDLVLKLMSFVTVKNDAGMVMTLSNWDIINNHVKNAEVLADLEIAMLKYNFSFFQPEGA